MGKKQDEEPFKEICEDCDCEHHSILHSALHHTVSIILFIFAVNLILGAVMEFAGEDTVKTLLMSDSIVQPFIAGIIGFIPNCAASVVLEKHQKSHSCSCAKSCDKRAEAHNALDIKLSENNMKENFAIMGILYVFGVAAGFVASLF